MQCNKIKTFQTFLRNNVVPMCLQRVGTVEYTRLVRCRIQHRGQLIGSGVIVSLSMHKLCCFLRHACERCVAPLLAYPPAFLAGLVGVCSLLVRRVLVMFVLVMYSLCSLDSLPPPTPTRVIVGFPHRVHRVGARAPIVIVWRPESHCH